MDRELDFKEASALFPAVQKPLPKAPWHLYALGSAAFVWSLLALFDFTAILLRFGPYTQQMSEMALAFVHETPAWVMALRGLSIVASMAGALLLIRRRAHATGVMALAATLTILSVGFSFARPVPEDSMAVFAVCVVVVSVLLLHYTQTMARRGVLR
ncbi:hypothetical protein [Hyphomonas sp.]|uniref:hypothetical protein n=1 Tax=Hyphomonas sp. TaxID=87 RepID=UPI00391A9124